MRWTTSLLCLKELKSKELYDSTLELTYATHSHRVLILLNSLFNWTVPFVSTMVCVAMTGATVVLYLVPIKFLLFAFGKYMLCINVSVGVLHVYNHLGLYSFRN